MNPIKTRGLSAGSLFKLLFCGLIIPLFVFGLICGIAAFFGSDTVSFNDQFVHGGTGLLAGVILGVVLPAVLSAVLWVILEIGLWLWTRFAWITLKFKE